MNTAAVNDTETAEMLQALMNAGISPRLKNALEPLEGLAQFLVSLLYHETLDFIGRD